MTDAQLDAFYEQQYRSLYQGSQGPTAKDLSVQKARAGLLLGFTRRKVTRISRHLDIGCSAGLLLTTFQLAYGCDSVGIEPGEAYRSYSQAQGLQVYSSLEQLSYELDSVARAREQANDARFDLISMAHVLEHLADPVGYLADVSQHWLAPGGWLLIEVPNLYGHDCFEVAHLVSFSPYTLNEVLKKAGYVIQLQRIHGQPLSEKIPLYLTVLAQVASISQDPEPGRMYPSVLIRSEKRVRYKRQLAMLRRKLVARLYPKKAWLPLPRDS